MRIYLAYSIFTHIYAVRMEKSVISNYAGERLKIKLLRQFSFDRYDLTTVRCGI